LIEAKTYRHRGHYEGDMGAYRPPDEVSEWLARDPIILFGRLIVEKQGVAQERLDEVAAEVERELEEAAAFAEASAHPAPEEALDGAGVGASLLGGRPVVEIMFSDFAALAMDMIANQAAKTHYMTGGRLSAPLTIRLVTGTAGATAAQHSQSLEAWFVHVP